MKEYDMNKIDQLINQTLSEEDERLLQDFSNEPGYFTQAFALFTGRLGWVMWLVGIIQLIFFIAAVYALFQLFSVEALLPALRWGVMAVVLVQLSVFLRGFMGMHFEANRVLREVKLLELRLIQK
ncbi:MAG: DUF6768 family protein [Wenzhouxiangella sp.]